MERVDDVLVMLQPVAGCDGATTAADAGVVHVDELSGVELLQRVVARQHGLAVGRPQVGKDEAVALLHGVPGLAHLVAELAAQHLPARHAPRLAREVPAGHLDRAHPARLPGVDDGLAYSVYLCAGLLTWGLFSEITLRSQSMFLENANLLKKLSFPRLCLPVVVASNALLNFGIVFGLFIAFLAAGIRSR